MAEYSPDMIRAFEEEVRAGRLSVADFTTMMNQSAKKLSSSASEFTNTFSAGSKSIYGGVENFAKSMANGAQGASAFGGVITGVADGAGKFSEMLSALGPLGATVSKTFSSIANFGAEYVVRALKQSDDLFNTFQGLSKVGGAGENGMKEVFANMQQLGMTMNELPQFGALIAKNSEALAIMGGTVAEGTKKFAGVASGIQQSGLQAQFERMGITVQEQNERTATYLKLQNLTSAGAVKSQESLTAGAAEYIRQQDRLSRLTGKSADALGKEEEARQKNERYAALTLETQMKADALRASGDEAGAKAAEAQLKMNDELLKRTPESLKQGVQDLMSGNVNSPEAQKLFISMPEMAQKIMSQNFSSAEQLEDLIVAGKTEAKASAVRDIGLAKAGLSDKVNASMSGRLEFGKISAGETAKTAVKEQTAQAKGEGDVDVNNQVALREAQRSTTTAMDNLVKLGVGPVTAAMTSLATGINTAITTIPGNLIGERTKLTREPTADEIAREVNPNRGRANLPEEKFKSEITVTEKDLTEAWDKFLKNVMIALEKKPEVTTSPGTITPTPVPGTRPLPGPRSETAPVTPGSRPLPGPARLPGPNSTSRGAGPAYQTPSILDVSRPENQPSTRSAAADSTTELATVFSEGFKALSRGQTEQTASVDELVELMRRSVGVQGKILQTSRA